MKRTVVLGVGNLLMQDEGIGVHLAQALQSQPLPPGVEVLDAGTAVWETLMTLGPVDQLILLDAAQGGGEPGAVYRFRPEEVSSAEPMMVSLHQIDLLQALRMAELAGWQARQVLILGIEPATIGWGMHLSAALTQRFGTLVEVVRAEVQRAAQNVECSANC